MKIEIQATEKPELLREQIEERTGEAELRDGKIIIEAETTEFLEKIPGIDRYTAEGETHEGLKGRPVQEKAYVRIDSKEDAAKALLATMDGYDLVVLDSEREWDIRKLKEYNPDIKHLKEDEPVEFLDIEKAVGDIEGLEKIGIEISDEEADLVYREMLT